MTPSWSGVRRGALITGRLEFTPDAGSGEVTGEDITGFVRSSMELANPPDVRTYSACGAVTGSPVPTKEQPRSVVARRRPYPSIGAGSR
jgi:hypothetical protein